jgi:hypothetical protein
MVLKVKGEPAYGLSRPPIAFSLHWVDLFHAILFRVLKEPAFRISWPLIVFGIGYVCIFYHTVPKDEHWVN